MATSPERGQSGAADQDVGDRHAEEIAAGERFPFGANWRSFLSLLDEERIEGAVHSLRKMLETNDLEGKTFLDIGSGSGLFSLAARLLGAGVTSIDYDPDSVGCTAELRRRYFADDPDWRVLLGSVLDSNFVESLGIFDVVYSWGVLHHTGDMYGALDRVAGRIAPKGRLVIAIYNDQGWISNVWLQVKRIYCSGRVGRIAMSCLFMPYWAGRGLVVDLLERRNPMARYKAGQLERGMSIIHDWRDWLGGLPFEVARIEEIMEFLAPRGLVLRKLISVGGTMGNNQFKFIREGVTI